MAGLIGSGVDVLDNGFEMLRWGLVALAVMEAVLSALLVRPHLGKNHLGMLCGGAFDCRSVVLSRYGLVRVLPPVPVPVAALGLGYYTWLAIGLATVGPLPGPWHHVWAVPAVAGLAGLASSAWFLYVMWRKLHDWCIVCLLTHAGNFLIVPGLWIVWLAGGTAEAHFAATLWKTPVLALALGVAAALAEIYYIQTRRTLRMLDKAAERLHQLQTEQFLAARPVSIPVGDNDPVLGGRESPHTAVIFGDFACSSCAELHRVVNLLHRRLGHSLRIVHKDFPLNRACNPGRRDALAPDHEPACKAAIAAEAAFRLAGASGFHHMAELLYEHQHLLPRDPYEKLARRIGLNVEAFNCVRDECEVLKEVQKDAALGAALGISATPAVFLDGRLLPNPVVQRGPELLLDETLEHWQELLNRLDRKTRRHGDPETRRQGDKETEG